MSSRDQSATAPSCLALSNKQLKKPSKREYLATYKKTEQQLIALQRDVQEGQQKHEELNEKNLILAGLIHVQERIKAIHDKHKRWLAAGGPTAEELKLQQQLEVDHQVEGCHWCLYSLETATWEQLQTALSYDCAQWVKYLNKYFQKLVFLTELLRRPPEQQTQLLQASGISPAPHLPLVYNFKGLNNTLTPAWAAVLETLQTEGCLASLALLHGNFALLDAASRHAGTGQRCTPPPTFWARLAQRMRFSRVQKLHFKLALENHARQTRVAAAQGLQVLKETPSYAFLLACEAIAAQQQGTEEPPGSAAAAPGSAAAEAGWQATGVANGHRTPDSGGKSSQLEQRGTPDASAGVGNGYPTPDNCSKSSQSQQRGTPDAAAGVVNGHLTPDGSKNSQSQQRGTPDAPSGVVNGHPTPHQGSNSSQSQQRTTPDAAAAVAMLAPPPHAAATAAAGDGSAAPPAAAVAAAAAAALAGGGADVGITPELQRQIEAALAGGGPDVEMAPHAELQQLIAAALAGGGPDVDMAPGAELQRQFSIYVRQTAALSMFLTDTMSPEQGLIMNRGSYPFWPVPASICEAALQLPDGDSPVVTTPWQDADEVVPDSIELLLSQRRHTMSENHDSLIPTLMNLRL